jgi:hypothetical protein
MATSGGAVRVRSASGRRAIPGRPSGSGRMPKDPWSRAGRGWRLMADRRKEIVVTTKSLQTPEAQARRRAKYLTGLMWHAGAFLIINAFFWILDIAGGGGLNWALWITGTWGFALAFHALAYYIDGRGLEARKAQEYLEGERREAPLP